ncbi:hypothetical protein CIB48_g4004 [Xylaria polymorpha]|nr:hypothetical protein CIB48_g4004 [Xylaria polymorpha]
MHRLERMFQLLRLGLKGPTKQRQAKSKARRLRGARDWSVMSRRSPTLDNVRDKVLGIVGENIATER